MSKKPHTVILANLGAPSQLSEVKPFLKNLFSDPDIFHFPGGKVGSSFLSSFIATIRAPKSKRYYSEIGGGSPLHENTLQQAQELQEALSNIGHFNVLVGQRYWNPYLTEVASSINIDKINKIVLIPLYPQYSTTTTLSIINEWKRIFPDHNNTIYIERFYNNPFYIKACTELIKTELKIFKSDPYIIFSAHSIPVKRIKNGDPYEKEIAHSVELIMKKLKKTFNFSIAYQSKVGPVEWLSPSVEEEIDRIVKLGVKNLLVFPISFVSEHLETLYELDIQKRDYAIANGIQTYRRSNTVQTHPAFIQCLKNLVLESIK